MLNNITAHLSVTQKATEQWKAEVMVNGQLVLDAKFNNELAAKAAAINLLTDKLDTCLKEQQAAPRNKRFGWLPINPNIRKPKE